MLDSDPKTTPDDYRTRFEARWTAAQPALAAYFTAVVGDVREVDDLLQRVAVTAFAKREQYSPDRSRFLTWVTGIARIEVMRWRDERARDRRMFSDAVLDHVAQAQERVSDELLDIRHALQLCLHETSDRAQQMIRLRYASGLTTEQIAGEMRMTVGSLRVALTRVRIQLRECVRRRLRLGEGEL